MNRNIIDALFSDDKIISYVIEKQGNSFFKTMIFKSGYKPFSDYSNTYNDIFLVLEKSISDNLLREKIISIFKRFNIQLASGSIMFSKGIDYVFSFFLYLQRNLILSNQPLFHILQYLENVSATFLPAISKDIPIMRKQIRVLLNQFDENLSLEKYTSQLSKLTEVESGSNEKVSINDGLYKQLLKEIEGHKTKIELETKRNQVDVLIKKNRKIYISNSGLVILHPFFNFYFNTLGIIENANFKNTDSQIRAVLLMQYLITGRVNFDEHELVLNKVLCDFPIEEAIPLELQPTLQEIELTTELFNVLKERWVKVKNSSIEGIRASFLLRDGALEVTEDGWKLIVEQRGYDMLLQTLPWSFGFIKLTWMNKILNVEWI